MTDLTPYYWAVIYRIADQPDGPLISGPMREPSAEHAADRMRMNRKVTAVLNVAGPFGTPAETEAYRLSWMREQRATAQTPAPIARQRTIADLLDEAASVIHTNELRDRPGRTPAQNAALPEPVTLYGAMNIVICGDPADTRGDRNGVNSADLVRAFSAFLNQGSPLEWSQAPERTHAEIMNALRGCASALRDAAGRAEVFETSDPADAGEPIVNTNTPVHVGDVLRRRDTGGTFAVAGWVAGNRGLTLAPDDGGKPFYWSDYGLPDGSDTPFTLVSCPHPDAGTESGTDDPADYADVETVPDFPTACASVHEHDPADCAPEEPAPAVTTATETASRGTVWAVTAETFGETDTDAATESPETFVRLDDITALVAVHRAAGASVEITWPFGSDGTGIPTYVHVYVDGRGVVTYRRANPGESDL